MELKTTGNIPTNNVIDTSKKNLQSLFNSMEDFVFVLDMEANILHVNLIVLKRLGYSKGELIGNSALTVHPPAQREDAAAIIGEMVKGNREICPIPLLNKEGVVIPVETKVTKGKWGDQDVLFGISRDVTEHKKFEQKLKESEEKYRFLINNILDEVIEFDMSGKITYVSPQVFDLLGYTPEEVIGTNALKYAHPDDLISVAEAMKNTVSSKDKVTLEFRLRHKNGHYIYTSTGGNYVYKDGKGKILGVIRDITERKKVEEALQLQRDHADLYKDIFAHDINNILQNIQSSLELSSLYIRNPEKSSTVKELYGIIKEQVARGSKLISNVRKLSTIQGSKFKLKSVKVNHFLKQAIKYLRQSFQTRRIEIQCNYNKEDYFVSANELLLDVYENLLLNAVRHNSNVNVMIEIKISKEKIKSEKYLKIQFIDNGDGIEPIRKKHIFERGSKEKSSNGGMGLGLSLVKKTIDRYKGKIWVEDRIKGDYTKGSNFIVLIPDTT
jgi:PAS domain S-box-containing protein